ncbi:hypothetical protein CCACVL1_03910 [Corchorus capsularis]|uniref:PPIase cyclophilin-type domain-containing protein n=1 Tax=Corchorus capsularis TaxID=210143 RepID=A0A1R3JW99_COCAP|nr:hypothetical protein CCACVL1_03910 [Corchorus capsularis]
MANMGPNTNGSHLSSSLQLLKPLHLDGKHVFSFRKVIKGMAIVRSIEHFATEDGDYPSSRSHIIAEKLLREQMIDGISNFFFKDGYIYPDSPADLAKKTPYC